MLTADLFSGGGRGWDIHDGELGLRSIGFEHDKWANKTARAAGHDVCEGDVRKMSPRSEKFVGGKFSPPCQTFARMGSGSGRRDLEVILDEMEWVYTHGRIDYSRFTDMRTGLVLEPLRWAMEGDFDWLVMEQVPDVLPIWDRMAKYLQLLGYSTDTGYLHAEQFGVPQTRKRAVLIASRSREAKLPTPTHSRLHPSNHARVDPGTLPCVSMADALGWDRPWLAQRSNQNNSATGQRSLRRLDQPSTTITRKIFHWVDEINPNDLSEPATVEHASILQSFPPGHPWQGGTIQARLQVGNAIPPLLAKAILKQVV